jgi:hypothetical protein
VGVAALGYCVYFDYKRRSQPDYKAKVAEREFVLSCAVPALLLQLLLVGPAAALSRLWCRTPGLVEPPRASQLRACALPRLAASASVVNFRQGADTKSPTAGLLAPVSHSTLFVLSRRAGDALRITQDPGWRTAGPAAARRRADQAVLLPADEAWPGHD